MNRLLLILILFTIIKAEAQTVKVPIESKGTEHSRSSALAIGDSLYALGDYNGAITEFLKIPETGTVKLKLAKSYEASGNLEESIFYYKKYISKNPKATIAKYNYGELLINVGQFQKADSVFKKLSEENTANANFLYQRGIIAEKLKDSTAFKHFLNAYSIDSSHQNSIYKLARKAVEEREFSAAKNFIEKGLSQNSNSNRFLTLDALENYYSKSYHASIKSWNKLLSKNQNNEQIHQILGLCYYNTNQFEKAVEEYNLLIDKYEAENPSYHITIAKFYNTLNNLEEAKMHIETAILLKRQPLGAEYMELANIFKRQKKYKSEMEALNKSIIEDPGFETAHYLLAVAADNHYKDKAEVLKYYEKYIETFGESGRFRELAKVRATDLKAVIHLGN